MNRAERRRREKAATKSPFRDKPVLLGSRSFRLFDGAKGETAIEVTEGVVTGPGILVVVGRMAPHASAPETVGGRSIRFCGAVCRGRMALV